MQSFKKHISICFILVIFLSFFFCIGIFLSECYPKSWNKDVDISEDISDEKIISKISWFGRGAADPEFSILDASAGENLAIRYKGNGSGFLDIIGYCYVNGEKTEIFNSSYVLQDSKSKKFYLIPTKQLVIDIDNSSSEIDYSNTGMRGTCWIKFLKKNTTYKLYILYRNNNHNILIDTEESLYVD